jgi:hypothetical protein
MGGLYQEQTPEQKRAGRFLAAVLIPSFVVVAALAAAAWTITEVVAIPVVVVLLGLGLLSWKAPQLVRRRFPRAYPAPQSS